MKFLIITYAPTLKKGNKHSSYAPYVSEINIWSKYISQLGIISPIFYDKELLEAPFNKTPKVFPILPFSFISVLSSLKAIFLIPIICCKIFKAMLWADHIHLRCPGNVGLLGCFVQILFPSKPKTVKYAGNWDPNSKQPYSYKLQKWLLSNTFLTKNCKVLVYGSWKNQSKNIVPFFTATYSEKDIIEIRRKDFSTKIKFIFVGGFTKGKQPLKSVLVIEKLKSKGYNVVLDMYGDGVERVKVENYIQKNKLADSINLHGNVPKEIVKIAFQKAHFLVFISKSEGWPKVVAEAMFWSCLPITTAVSCVPFMIGYGNRGAIVTDSIADITEKIEVYLKNEKLYQNHIENAKKWSQEYTLEKFEGEISKYLN